MQRFYFLMSCEEWGGSTEVAQAEERKKARKKKGKKGEKSKRKKEMKYGWKKESMDERKKVWM